MEGCDLSRGTWSLGVGVRGISSADSCGGVGLCGLCGVVWGCAKKQSTFRFPAVRTAETVPTGEGCNRLGASLPGVVQSASRNAGRGTWFRRQAALRDHRSQARSALPASRPLAAHLAGPDRLPQGVGRFRGCCRIPGRRERSICLQPSLVHCSRGLPGPRRRGVHAGAEAALGRQVSGRASSGGARAVTPAGSAGGS